MVDYVGDNQQRWSWLISGWSNQRLRYGCGHRESSFVFLHHLSTSPISIFCQVLNFVATWNLDPKMLALHTSAFWDTPKMNHNDLSYLHIYLRRSKNRGWAGYTERFGGWQFRYSVYPKVNWSIEKHGPSQSFRLVDACRVFGDGADLDQRLNLKQGNYEPLWRGFAPEIT